MPNLGGERGPVRGMNARTVLGYLEFSPNGSSDPDTQYTKGSLKGMFNAVVHTSTGLYTLTSKKGFTGPMVRFVVWQVISGTTYFLALQKGQISYSAGVLTLLINTLNTSFALADIAASTGDARVCIMMFAEDSTGV